MSPEGRNRQLDSYMSGLRDNERRMQEMQERLEAGGRYEIGDHFQVFDNQVIDFDAGPIARKFPRSAFVIIRVINVSEATDGRQLITTARGHFENKVEDAKTWRASDLKKFTRGWRFQLTRALFAVQMDIEDKTLSWNMDTMVEDLRRAGEPNRRFFDGVDQLYKAGEYDLLLRSLVELMGRNLEDLDAGPGLLAYIEQATIDLQAGELDADTVRQAQTAIEKLLKFFNPHEASVAGSHLQKNKYGQRLDTVTYALVLLLKDLNATLSEQ